MPKLCVNGNWQQVDISNLAEFLATQFAELQHFAVAVNQAFVPKQKYSRMNLNDNDSIDIITPMQGG